MTNEDYCRLAFEIFNDGGTKGYSEDYYKNVFRPKYFKQLKRVKVLTKEESNWGSDWVDDGC